MNLAIETNFKLVYEGASPCYGYPVWPSPIIFTAVISSEETEMYEFGESTIRSINSYIFREESNNTASRIRRGRLYKSGDSQPKQWHLYPHPVLPEEIKKAEMNGGTIEKSVYAFHSVRLKSRLRDMKIKVPIFLLGTKDSFTIWSLIDIETSAMDEEIITLKERVILGALPKTHINKILKAGGQSVIDAIDKLSDELYRAGPESIVDCAREAATAILSKYFQSIGVSKPGKDLGDLAKKAEDSELVVVANTARTLSRFHARRKHAVKEKMRTRPITEHDAEFCVHAVGLILCELEWGYW